MTEYIDIALSDLVNYCFCWYGHHDVYFNMFIRKDFSRGKIRTFFLTKNHRLAFKLHSSCRNRQITRTLRRWKYIQSFHCLFFAFMHFVQRFNLQKVYLNGRYQPNALYMHIFMFRGCKIVKIDIFYRIFVISDFNGFFNRHFDQ